MSSLKWILPEATRIYLDYPEDLEFLREVYKRLPKERKNMFSTQDLVDLLRSEPELLKINSHLNDVPVR